MGLRVVSGRDAFSPEGGAFGWGFRKNSFVEGDSHRGIVFADGCSYSIAPQIVHGEEDMHGIARGHFVSTPLEYAFDHEVSSLPYVIWRLFRQHRFGFAASILAWSTWSRRSGLAAIGGTVRYSKVQVRSLSAYSHSMALVLLPGHSSCTQFSVPSRVECRQVTPCRVSSASGTKAGTTSKTFFKLRALSFCFCPKGRGGPPL